VPGRALNQAELRAAATVAVALCGSVVPRDVDGASEATHDFDIVTAGLRIALEVTTAADDAHVSMESVAYSQAFPAPDLANSWLLGLPITGGGDIVIKGVVKRAPALLAVFERHDIKQLFDFDDWTLGSEPQDVAEAAMILRQLGVTSAIVFGEGADNPVVLFAGHGGGTANPEHVNLSVAEAAQANLVKLLAADADERHLFVWIAESHPGGELAMHVGILPSGPPELPTGIDVAWAASAHGARLWRVQPPGAWELVEVAESHVERLLVTLGPPTEPPDT
jgi:hypothetical protein